MEGKVCGYSKFGYCKYKSNCKKIHLVQLCEDLDKFKNIKTCRLRHPKGCKKFAVGQCRFGEECEYHHKDKTKSNEQCKCKDKVDRLEIKIETMALKILALEKELTEVKQNKKVTPKDKETQSEKVLKALSRKVLNLDSEIEDIKRKNSEKENKNQERLEINDENPFVPPNCTSPKQSVTGSKQKVQNCKRKNEIKEVLFNCNICD